LVRVGRVTEKIGIRGRNPVDIVDTTRCVALGESFGVPAVALETFDVSVGSVLSRLFEVCSDGSMNERCVDLFERPNWVSEAVHQHLTSSKANKLLAETPRKAGQQWIVDVFLFN
jgi:hypothetical protein